MQQSGYSQFFFSVVLFFVQTITHSHNTHNSKLKARKETSKPNNGKKRIQIGIKAYKGKIYKYIDTQQQFKLQKQ